MAPRRPKDIGTEAETKMVRFLAANGWPNVERRALRGTDDQGDVTGTPGLVWEVKGGEAAKTASDLQIRDWLHETERERTRAHAAYGFLITARRQKNVSAWWAHMWADQLADLCGASDGQLRPAAESVAVRVTLTDLVGLLHDAGWADTTAEAVAS